MAEAFTEVGMNMHQNSATQLEEYPPQQTLPVSPQQAELWSQIVNTTKSEQELLLLRASLIDALPPRAIYALYPDQFANVAAIYRMKHMLFKQLRHNPVIERLCAEAMLTPDRDT
jgi:hypothetical protein